MIFSSLYLKFILVSAMTNLNEMNHRNTQVFPQFTGILDGKFNYNDHKGLGSSSTCTPYAM